MDWLTILMLVIGSLMVFMASGLPIAFCFLAVDTLCVYLFWGGASGIETLTTSIFGGLSTFILLPIPLFILMGELIAVSGFGSDMIKAVDQWLGRLPGRLSIVSVIGGVIIATLTGTNIASISLLGDTLLPEMKKKGYRHAMSLGPIIGSSCLAMMIPPSAPAVLLGAIAEISVGKLLIAIILPGILMAVVYAAYILIRCMIQPTLAPAYDAPRIPFWVKVVTSSKSILAIAVIIFLVIGIMFLGIAGPSEAAATGAFGTLILCLARKSMDYPKIKQVFLSTLRITVMMFMIIAGSKAFSQILAFTGASKGMVELLTGIDIQPLGTLIMMQIILLILGCFMDAFSIMLITVPIFMPIIQALHFNPIWFGVMFLINLDMGGLTPPFGLALFTMKGIAPEFSMQEIISASVPFLLLDALVIAIIMVFPAIALWLPSVMK